MLLLHHNNNNNNYDNNLSDIVILCIQPNKVKQFAMGTFEMLTLEGNGNLVPSPKQSPNQLIFSLNLLASLKLGSEMEWMEFSLTGLKGLNIRLSSIFSRASQHNWRATCCWLWWYDWKVKLIHTLFLTCISCVWMGTMAVQCQLWCNLTVHVLMCCCMLI